MAHITLMLVSCALLVTQTVIAGQALSDDKWHSVSARRRGRHIKVKVDQEQHVDAELHGDSSLLDHDKIYIGQQATDTEYDDSYTGYMQHVALNGQSVVGRGWGEEGEASVVMTAKVHDSHDPQPVTHAMTFDSAVAYVVVKQRIYATFQVHMQLRTSQANCLLLYSGAGETGGQDFLALELVDGYLHYVFDTGGGIREISLDKGPKVNDNRWHDVSILRPVVQKHVLRVDGYSVEDNVMDSRALHFDLDEKLFIGGTERLRYGQMPVQVKVRRGFVGCLASVDINGDIYTLTDHRIHLPPEHRLAVRDGCHAPDSQCRSDTCQNGGACKHNGQGVTCNCDMTTFTGPTCADASVAYTFGANGGLLTYSYPRDHRPNARKDQLAVGIMTSQRDAILFRVSGTSEDFIEMELADGSVLVTYNMGTASHEVSELTHKVNDSRYHTIRFHRQGPNSTLQIDGHTARQLQPRGEQLSTFNNQASIHVGGKRDPAGRIVRPFRGTLAGLTFNGLRLMEMASTGDAGITVTGDVERLNEGLTTSSEPTHKQMLSTMGVKVDDKRDDRLIVNHADCHQTVDTNCQVDTSDSLITVTVKSRPSTTTSTLPTTPTRSSTSSTPGVLDTDNDSGSATLCDDEECEWAVGSGKPETDSNAVASASSPPDTPDTDDTGVDISAEVDIDEVPQIPREHQQPPHHAHPTPGVGSSTVTPANPLVVTVSLTEQPVTRRHPIDGLTAATEVARERVTLQPPTTTTVRPHHARTPPSEEPNRGASDGGQQQRAFLSTGLNVALFLGVCFAILILVAVLVYAVYKWRSGDVSNSCKVEVTHSEQLQQQQYVYSPCPVVQAPPPHAELYNNNNVQQVASRPIEQCSKPNKRDVKEWYV